MPQFCPNLEAVGLDGQEMLDFKNVFGVIFTKIKALKYDGQSLFESAFVSVGLRTYNVCKCVYSSSVVFWLSSA